MKKMPLTSNVGCIHKIKYYRAHPQCSKKSQWCQKKCQQPQKCLFSKHQQYLSNQIQAIFQSKKGYFLEEARIYHQLIDRRHDLAKENLQNRQQKAHRDIEQIVFRGTQENRSVINAYNKINNNRKETLTCQDVHAFVNSINSPIKEIDRNSLQKIVNKFNAFLNKSQNRLFQRIQQTYKNQKIQKQVDGPIVRPNHQKPQIHLINKQNVKSMKIQEKKKQSLSCISISSDQEENNMNEINLNKEKGKLTFIKEQVVQDKQQQRENKEKLLNQTAIKYLNLLKNPQNTQHQQRNIWPSQNASRSEEMDDSISSDSEQLSQPKMIQEPRKEQQKKEQFQVILERSFKKYDQQLKLRTQDKKSSFIEKPQQQNQIRINNQTKNIAESSYLFNQEQQNTRKKDESSNQQKNNKFQKQQLFNIPKLSMDEWQKDASKNAK